MYVYSGQSISGYTNAIMALEMKATITPLKIKCVATPKNIVMATLFQIGVIIVISEVCMLCH